MNNYFIPDVVCYLLGSIPFSVVFSKFFLKKDIREIGSGNIGTSNAYRTGGALFATVVALLDIAKGVAAVLYIMPAGHMNLLGQEVSLTSVAMMAVCIGQMYPIFLNFKGGKGVGVFIGTLIGLNPVYGLIIGISWILVTKISKMPFFSSLLALGASLLVGPNDALKFAVIGLIIFRHSENIKAYFKKNS